MDHHVSATALIAETRVPYSISNILQRRFKSLSEYGANWNNT